MTDWFLIRVLVYFFPQRSFPLTVNITVDEDLLHINWTEFQKHLVLNSSH